MLIIRAEQMQALDEQMERHFARRLAGSLRRFFPFRFARADDAAAEEFAFACVKHAKTLGLQTEGGIHRYANVCALIGTGFEATAWGIKAGLAPGEGENRETAWLDRIVPMVEQRFRERRPA
jgi:hypothetical protein